MMISIIILLMIEMTPHWLPIISDILFNQSGCLSAFKCAAPGTEFETSLTIKPANSKIDDVIYNNWRGLGLQTSAVRYKTVT